MHWFYGLLLMGIIFYGILKLLPEPPKNDGTKGDKRQVNTSSSKSKKKKNKKGGKAGKAQAQVQAKLSQKIQKKNTPPQGKSNALDENEWPTLEKINEEKKAAAAAKSKNQKKKKQGQSQGQPQSPSTDKKNEFNITHFEKEGSSTGEDDDETSEREHVRKSSDKPVLIQNVSLPLTNRRYKKHIVQENQKYISSDDEEISDGEIKVLRVVDKKEEIEQVELPPEVDGWKNVVPKKSNILVIKSSSNPTPVVQKTYIRKPKEEPLTKKQKENRKKAEKKKLEKQRERELQEERLRKHRAEQQRLNVGYRYVPPPKPRSKVSKVAPAPVITPTANTTSPNKSKAKEDEGWISVKVPAGGITSLWGN